MADLILGPVLRYVAETAATVWVETDAPCRVEILGHETATFQVEGHHYALLPITGLEPGNEYEYEVALDGKKRWPRSPGSARASFGRFPPTFEADQARIRVDKATADDRGERRLEKSFERQLS